ncbi:TRPM8 channel-associated factor 3-like [Lepus europaeus]|uniref:TRPM8 channel-associated factor 3-like n=1 Tax=Lepus europaeus TaxID=9983 RepID=UPI002B47785E|nr:TRPM8 channel-associated factor 3-like [Lepus europaeus]
MATTPAAAFQVLVNGVTSWNIPPEPLPSELLLIGEATFPVMVNDEGRVVIAASSFAQGRLVVVAHEEYLIHAPLAPFLVNVVSWLCPSPEASIGVNPSLESLVKLLQDSGVKAQVESEPGESLGVYCTNAYDDSMTEKLIQFVKRGGGLLIGGHAQSWVEKHGSDKVLSEFPGNQVTSVAGVYFTDSSVDRRQWVVSETLPTISFHVTCGENFGQDQKQLLEGITELNLNRGGIPSYLLVHGPLAFPLGLDSSLNCFLAAARYGHGRVVLCGHESMVFESTMEKFLINAVRWLKGQQKGKVGVSPQVKALGNLLTKYNVEWTSTTLPTRDLSVYCCASLHNVNARKVEDFVAEGGGILTGSQAWYWSYQNPDSNYMIDYPSNGFLKRVGLAITVESGNKGIFPVPKPEMLNYHIRKVLPQFESMLFNKGKVLEKSWLEKLKKDISNMFRIPHNGIPIYESVHQNILKMINQKGLPTVNKENPISRASPQDLLIAWGRELFKSGTPISLLVGDNSPLPSTESPVSIEITTDNRDSWVSTGLYLPEGRTAKVTVPENAVAAKLKVQIGCHTDDIGAASTYYRPPLMTYQYYLNETNKSISWLWGGLLYILVPPNYNLDTVQVTISGAVRAPYFKLGKTSQEEWKHSLQGNPAPWGELATDNIILTVPSENLKSVNNPESLLQLWDEMMQAAAKLASEPFPYHRPERIVTDVQISVGLMHAGYPIMGLLAVVPGVIDEERIRRSGVWGPLHEVGHNFQRSPWMFYPHTLEASCNLWAIYVHEKILGISRDRAHKALRPANREQRIKMHMDKGAPLSNWETWTALETYLQLQEAFGWDPFIQLFADYQVIAKYPNDNAGKMNLWMKKFSEIVQKNLVPFFKAWGWPIQKEVADGLAHLPEWEENPMKEHVRDTL